MREQLGRAALCMALVFSGWPSMAAAGAVESKMRAAECALGTEDSHLQQFHLLAHYPYEYSLRFPGIVVGVEKSDADLVIRGARAQQLLPGRSGELANAWTETLLTGQRKAMFISHVLRTIPSGDSDLVFNVYGREYQLSAEKDSRAELNSAGVPWLDCARRHVSPGDQHAASWDGVSEVKKALTDEFAKRRYSHLLVIVMGWNTSQAEVIQNVHSLRRQLTLAAPGGKSFQPYVVALTWPSQWDSGWLEVPLRVLSLGNKADDADEIGAGWLGAVLRHAVLPAARATDTPVVAIGHSFGARALSHAICLDTRLAAPNDRVDLRAPEPAAGQVEWFVNLQGAYSLNRFREGGAGWGVNLAYPNHCPVAKNVLLTASKHDSAGQAGSAALGGGHFAGSKDTWTRAASDEDFYARGMPTFSLFKASKSGCVAPTGGPFDRHDSKFKYLDADDLITFNATGTGAGAHSDIYRLETARAVWSFLEGRCKT